MLIRTEVVAQALPRDGTLHDTHLISDGVGKEVDQNPTYRVAPSPRERDAERRGEEERGAMGVSRQRQP